MLVKLGMFFIAIGIVKFIISMIMMHKERKENWI